MHEIISICIQYKLYSYNVLEDPAWHNGKQFKRRKNQCPYMIFFMIIYIYNVLLHTKQKNKIKLISISQQQNHNCWWRDLLLIKFLYNMIIIEKEMILKPKELILFMVGLNFITQNSLNRQLKKRSSFHKDRTLTLIFLL